MIDFGLYLITDRRQVVPGQTLGSVIEQALAGGVKAVQLREKDLSADQLLPLAIELRQLTSRHGAKLFINHNVDVALEIDADGVHLGGQSPPASEIRKRVGPDKLIGVSTHSRGEIRRAAEQGADFVTFGPVFPTPSKAMYGPPQGLAALRDACQTSPLPVFALGGIKSEHLAEIIETGARGIALISAIIASPDPKGAAQTFLA